MGPVTVALLRHIFLHNLSRSQSPEEQGVSRMFQKILEGFAEVCTRQWLTQLGEKKLFETLEYDNRKMTSHFCK